MKNEFQKFFGNLVIDQIKHTIFENMSKYQLGTKPGHRAQEHLFVLKSAISLYTKYDRPLILTLWDIRKYFDSECLVDVMNELYRNGVHGKPYRLLYLMNRNVRIRVHTPVGPSKEKDVGETLRQATVDGAITSAVSLDNSVRDFFARSDNEVQYFGIKLGPLLFQDDVARLALDIDSAQSANERMRNVAETKLLDFNLAKSCYIVFGPKQRRHKMHKLISEQPLKMYGKEMTQERTAKYLGDYVSEKGLADSVAVTVDKRKFLVNKAIYDIKAVLNDCRSHLTGGLVSGFDIWELAVVPMLLYNAETWQDISKRTITELENIQLKFARSVFAIGVGCPTPLLYSETGLILMELRILQKKLNFLHHLENLPDTALAKEVLRVQTEQNLPGIVSECRQYLAKFEIFDLRAYSKAQFRKLIKAKILDLNKTRIVEQAKHKQYKKVDVNDLSSNDFRLKDYIRNLSATDARIKFRLASQMTQQIKMNFQSDRMHAESLWTCEGCSNLGVIGYRDTQQHILVCPAYTEFREGKDLSKDNDLVNYFKQVLKLRAINS